MNEIVDELRDKNQDRFASIELPDDDELVLIQEQILLHLPNDLKDFLLSVSDVAYGTLQPVTATDDCSHTYLPEMTSVAWDKGMPREFIAICAIDKGYYFIAQEGYVGIWSYDRGVLKDDHWESIWDWCERVWLAS